MKTLLVTIATIAFSSLSAIAQMKEGHIQYTIDMSSDNPEMEMAITMMQGSKMESYFTEDASRTEMTMGSFMTNTTIIDFKAKRSIVLMSGMMGKQAIVTENTEDENGEVEEFDVQLLDESKEIAGYQCKKALVTNDEGNELIYWYTEDIAYQNNNKSNIDLPGLPLEFQIVQSDMTMTMTATSVEKKFKKSKDMFSTEVPEGFQVTTVEELQKGMMGGQ